MILNPSVLAELSDDEYQAALFDRVLDRHRCTLGLPRNSVKWQRIRSHYLGRLARKQAVERAAKQEAQAEEETALKAEFQRLLDELPHQAPNSQFYGPSFELK